ncbi:GNAT family N-acetyltransferase [Amycolatopsis sp. YIM 10]|uniref:GNAT family N-acetyltransferase n=1 Tax=Amycolatopsis sp. YIM 10 TaxID=2653857 RepID=UPI001290502D|nr:GNAT family N-acetyltransferase [Amycolatopsis sp. YIM 10]QFU92335.1 Acetyltransferase (GNAT) family protein [Amycolatopsis sp. YIM 10]
MSLAQVRAATTTDVPEIARIQRETWRVAYAEFLGEQALAALDAPETEQHWTAAVEHPGTAVLVATEGEFTVGFCVAGKAPADEVASAAGELPEDAESVGLIATMLVEPRWGRRGHGGRLLGHAARELRELGAERGVSWVAQSDSASLAFYKRVGWHPDGTVRTLDTGEKTIRELRLTGSLAYLQLTS